MPLRKWSDIKAAAMSTECVERIHRKAEKAALEMSLRELREASGKTAEEAQTLARRTEARLTGHQQREDQIAAFREYVEELGGAIEMVAVFGNKRITLVGM